MQTSKNDKKQPGKRKIRLRIRRGETKKSDPPPVPKKQFTIRIKANGLEKTCLTSLPEDSGEDLESDLSDEDFEPVPTWTVNQSGGKTIRYGDQMTRRKRSRSSSLERSEAGRIKRKKRNIEGKLELEAYGWILEICSIVGHQQKKKRVLNLIKTGLQGGFVTGMANAAQKDGFVASLSSPDGEIRAGGIFHIEHCGKSLSYTCLSIFATDPRYQKMGLGRMLTAYIIQRSLLNHLKIVVLARPEAVPFWCHSTMGFREMSIEEQRKYNRPVKGKKKKKDELVDLIYDGPTSDLISLSLLRFRPSEPVQPEQRRPRRSARSTYQS